MRRREFIMLVGGTVAWPVRVRAQQPALPVVALVSLRSAEVRLANAFRKGLDEAGYAEGQNVIRRASSLLSSLAADRRPGSRLSRVSLTMLRIWISEVG